jgi:hypothetical protein
MLSARYYYPVLERNFVSKCTPNTCNFSPITKNGEWMVFYQRGGNLCTNQHFQHHKVVKLGTGEEQDGQIMAPQIFWVVMNGLCWVQWLVQCTTVDNTRFLMSGRSSRAGCGLSCALFITIVVFHLG